MRISFTRCRSALLRLSTLGALLMSAVFAPSASMQTGPAIHPSVIAGGGGSSSNGNLRLEGTTGQSPVGDSSGASFTLNAGFWHSAGACLSLSGTSQSFAASGGTGTVDVFGLTACAWTATSNDPGFITITSGNGGSGDGLVTYTVAAHNNTSTRSGTITIAGQTFTVVQGAAFFDVPPTHPFYTVIGKLSARGVTLGCGSGNYCPSANVSREQMAAFIIRAKGEFNPPLPASQRFNDVPPSNLFYNFIDRMAVLQITLGCGGGNYCPTASVTREQMAAFLIRGLGEFNPPLPASQRFTDVPPQNPFYNFIDRMAVLQITLGCSVSPPLYCPSNSVTREQMAAFLVRAFNL